MRSKVVDDVGMMFVENPNDPHYGKWEVWYWNGKAYISQVRDTEAKAKKLMEALIISGRQRLNLIAETKRQNKLYKRPPRPLDSDKGMPLSVEWAEKQLSKAGFKVRRKK